MFKNSQILLLVWLGLMCTALLGSSIPGATAALSPDQTGSSTGPWIATPVELPQLSALATGCGGAAPQVMNADYEQRLVELVNAARQQAGAPPVRYTPALLDAARYHAFDMGEDDYFDHDTYDRPNGSPIFVCEWIERIQTFYSNLVYLGENIAAGSDTPEAAMALWMSSPGHRANIQNSDYWEFGGGFYNGRGSYGQYWVQDFGRRIGIYPLIINREAATTSDREVDLYIYGNWAEYRLRNNSELWTDWLPFDSTPTWNLPPQSGLHTVQADMRTSNSSASAADTISLDLADTLTLLLFLPLISRP